MARPHVKAYAIPNYPRGGFGSCDPVSYCSIIEIRIHLYDTMSEDGDCFVRLLVR